MVSSGAAAPGDSVRRCAPPANQAGGVFYGPEVNRATTRSMASRFGRAKLIAVISGLLNEEAAGHANRLSDQLGPCAQLAAQDEVAGGQWRGTNLQLEVRLAVAVEVGTDQLRAGQRATLVAQLSRLTREGARADLVSCPGRSCWR